MEYAIDLERKGYSYSMMQRLNGFRGINQHCDFKVKAESEEIPAHRNVLAAGSDYFNAMFSNYTLESQSGVVEIKEADAESVKKCIDFIYTGKVSISGGKYEQLMYVAHMFQLQQLCDEIILLLGQHLNAKTFLIAMKLANMYDYKQLEEKCDQFVLENLEAVCMTPEFTKLGKDFVLYLMKSRDTTMSEGAKLEAIIRWVNADRKNRKGSFMELVKGLDLLAVSLGYRRHLIESESLVNGNREIFAIFTVSILDSAHVEPHSTPDPQQKRKAIVVFDKSSCSLQEFDLERGGWRQRQRLHPDMHTSSCSAVAVMDDIYVLSRKSVYQIKYPNANAKWDRIANMLHDHGDAPPITHLGGWIFVVGGNGVMTAAAERYDISRNQWTKLPDKKVVCRDSFTATFQGCVYSFGGENGERCLNTVERFDPKAADWVVLPPMQKARVAGAAVGFKGKLYVVGGFDGAFLSSVECYSPVQNVWTAVTRMKLGRSHLRAFVFGNGILAVSGLQEANNNMELLRAEKNEWEVIGSWSGLRIDSEATVLI